MLPFSRTGCAVLFSATFAETPHARRSTGSRLSEQGAPPRIGGHQSVLAALPHSRQSGLQGLRPSSWLKTGERDFAPPWRSCCSPSLYLPPAPIRLTIGARPPGYRRASRYAAMLELRTLAIERIGAFVEAEARLSPEQQKALLADQNDWVRSYTRVCGLSDMPPALTLAPEVKACMARAGSARIAYLRAYGSYSAPPPLGQTSAPFAQTPPASATVASSPTRIGPSFDCSKASSPLALMICASPALSKVDLSFVQAYRALWQQVGRTGKASSCGKPSISRTRCCAPAASLKRGRSRDRRSASPLNTSGNVRSGCRD